MYDAIRDAFCEKPKKGWPKNLCPSDIGLGPYDYPPLYRSSVQAWDFFDSLDGWYRQPYGAAELWVKNGCLNFWVTRLGNFNIRQRVKSFDAHKYRKFHVRMKIIPSAGDRAESSEISKMRLKWGNQDNPIIGSKCSIDEKSNIMIASVKVDGEFHEYELNLSANLHWNGMIDELWFEACQVMHARVAVDWMRFE
jgi:hypothetical protein